MKKLLAALVGLVALDGIITNYLVHDGLAREGNPFLEPLVGDVGFITLKVGGALLCALILWDISRRYPKLARYSTLTFVVVYSVIVVWNISFFILK